MAPVYLRLMFSFRCTQHLDAKVLEHGDMRNLGRTLVGFTSFLTFVVSVPRWRLGCFARGQFLKYSLLQTGHPATFAPAFRSPPIRLMGDAHI